MKLEDEEPKSLGCVSMASCSPLLFFWIHFLIVIAPGVALPRRLSETRSLQLDYLYASPLDLASLDVRAEIEALAAIPGVSLTVPWLGRLVVLVA